MALRGSSQRSPALDFAARQLGNLGVADLERLATALWVRRELPEAGRDEQAARLHEIKPHISLTDAAEGLEQVESMEGEAAELLVA